MAIADVARNLRARLEDYERIPVDDVKAWMEEEGVPPKQIGLVFGHGAHKGRKWWHREGEELVIGPKEAEAAMATSNEVPPVDEDPLAMDSPEASFTVMVRRLGIPEKTANTAAYFCFANYDMTDPLQAWDAVQNTDINQSSKKKVWETWCNQQNIDVPHSVVEQVFRARGPLYNSTEAPTAKPALQQERYLAVNGEIVSTHHDDPGGLPYSAASENARYQREQIRLEKVSATPSDSPMVAALNSMSAVVAAAMAPKQDSTTLEWMRMLQEENRTARDIQREAMENMLKAQAEQNRLMMQVVAERQDSAINKLTEIIESMNMNPFAAIKEFLPHGDQLLERLFAPPVSQSGPTIQLGGAEVGIETYRQIKEEERKDGMFALARESLPRFLELGQDLATAASRLTAGEGGMMPPAGVQQPQIPEGYEITNCISCSASIAYDPEDEAFECPGCNTQQETPRAVAPPLERPEVEEEEVEEVDVETEEGEELEVGDAEELEETALVNPYFPADSDTNASRTMMPEWQVLSPIPVDTADMPDFVENVDYNIDESQEVEEEPAPKRGRGRPRKEPATV